MNKSTRKQLQRQLRRGSKSSKKANAADVNGQSKASDSVNSATHANQALECQESPHTQSVIVGLSLVSLVFAWAYWPTLIELVVVWGQEPDYSHGYLVIPLAGYFLWDRRDRFPGSSVRHRWPGLLLIAASIGMRYAGTLVHAEAVDPWSMLVYLAGVAWFVGGWKVTWWALPSIGFLWFMMPLPYRVERWLSLPLQGIATKLSCWTLQCLGQPAIAEGHTILLGDHQVEIEQACSGLRIFVGIVALAFVYCVLVRRSWWEKMALALSTIPIALVANAARIVLAGFLYQYTSGPTADRISHDLAGWLMIPFAALMFAGVLWYLGKLVPVVETADVRAVMRRELQT